MIQSRYLRYICWTLVVALTLLFAAGAQARTKMPRFVLEDVRNGDVLDSRSLKGQVLLLTFFATWCPPCVDEIPVLIELQEEYRGAGFSVIGMSVDRDKPVKIARFVKKFGINYPVLLANSKTTMDFGGVYGIPVSFLVNKSGNVVKKYTGYIKEAILKKDIRMHLN